jgi:hypothetical protein
MCTDARELQVQAIPFLIYSGSSPAKALVMMLGMSSGWRSPYPSLKPRRLKWLLGVSATLD